MIQQQDPLHPEWTRKLKFFPGYDKRSDVKGENYGIHGAAFVFELHHADAVVIFDLYTGWPPSSVKESWSIIDVCKGSGAWGWGFYYYTSNKIDEWCTETLSDWEFHSQFPWTGNYGNDFYRKLFREFVDKGDEYVWGTLFTEGEKILAKVAEEKENARRFS